MSEPRLEPSPKPSITPPVLRERFWQHYTLTELTADEWEALCDGCGLCCLVKLEDEDTGEVVYTKAACQLLDTKTARCTDYPNRQSKVPDCLQLTPERVPQLNWLPPSCAYRRLDEGKALPKWHPLITGNANSVRQARKSAAGRCISETLIDPEDIEEYVIRWVR
ncbi:YcgN family cysteine cluster protein [Aquirhabdus parva]|uniref:UPF0260 protein HYN46_01065 n=1 Tax=Aquirhabdus parva TaxID=2283318 RepID=A0A345P2V0_9GAMM|nr:YcgN family cysteine cluster protein [Aquirhabdus parva]AXI01609.1 YcgN family cysteine cluster protein [Aquirhabdus parva]